MIHDARGTKPIVAQVNATAASAAYWIASAADETAVTPSARVGSVGVIWSHQDASKAMKKEGVKTTLITAKDSPYKSEGHPFGPLGDEAAAHVQREVDEAGARFVKAVARNRNVSQGHVRDNFGKGRMLDADRAVAAGMADHVATMHQTLQRFGAGLYPSAPAPAGRRAFAAEREKRALQL
jgi:ClpP class serine protease